MRRITQLNQSTDEAVTPKRILVAGVGHDNLRDLSVGRILADRLRLQDWPAGVHVEDLSFGAVVVLHWLQQDAPYDSAVFLAGESRDRKPGTIHCYTWEPGETSSEEIQARVVEAVTGIVSLDTLLTVVGYFGALPPTVRVIEVEPRDHEWGPELSPPVRAAIDEVEAMVKREVEELSA